MELADTNASLRVPGAEAGGPAAMAAEYVRRRILGGEFRPGLALVPARLCRQAGVRASDLRDALKLLEREGLVRASETGRYFEVDRLKPLDLAATYEVREALDSLAAELATVGRLPEAIEGRFDAADAVMMNAAASASLDEISFERAHAAWHLALFDASGNPYLQESSRLVLAVSHCLVWRSIPGPEQRRYSTTVREMADLAVDDHARIRHAIRRGDAAGAARAARRHIRRGTNFARVVGTQLAIPGQQQAVG